MADNPTYPVSTIAKLLMISERRVQQLTKEGIIPKSERGRYELAPAVQGYIKFLQDRNLQVDDSRAIDYHAERNRKIKAEADLTTMQAQKIRGELVPLRQVERALAMVLAEVKVGMRNIPQRTATMLIGEQSETRIKEVLLTEIDQTLEAMANMNFEEPDGDD
jgi:Phage DNA packaging protein, Nu1 subunit of terminase